MINMQNQFKKICFTAVILILVIFASVACQQNAILKTTPAEENLPAEQVAENTTTQAEATDATTVPETTMAEPSEQNTNPTEAAQVTESYFEPKETGADPDADSAFAKLELDEKEALIEWLNSVASSFDISGDKMNGFINNEAVNDALNEGKKLAEIPEYIQMRDSVIAELDKVDALDTTALPQTAASLKEASDTYVKWCREFFPNLENQSTSDPKVLSGWIDERLQEAIPLIQKFLDELHLINS